MQTVGLVHPLVGRPQQFTHQNCMLPLVQCHHRGVILYPLTSWIPYSYKYDAILSVMHGQIVTNSWSAVITSFHVCARTCSSILKVSSVTQIASHWIRSWGICFYNKFSVIFAVTGLIQQRHSYNYSTVKWNQHRKWSRMTSWFFTMNPCNFYNGKCGLTIYVSIKVN